MEESFLFSDTVRANIAYGRPDATDEEIVAAAQAAQAHEFIARLPHGYDTLVGEQGLTLSGGQRQRVALARALVTDPRVLVLDDATSAIDPRLEVEIHAALREIMRGRTTLIIAHRRSTLNLADRIVVLESGRVADSRHPGGAGRALPAVPAAHHRRGRRRERAPDQAAPDAHRGRPARRAVPGARPGLDRGGPRAPHRDVREPAAVTGAAGPGRLAAPGPGRAGRGHHPGAGRRPALHAAQAAASRWPPRWSSG